MRLQVFLSRNGVCSRRKALDIIKAGEVCVNKKVVCEPSHAVDPDIDEVVVNGEAVQSKAYSYLLMNKPSGVVTTKADKFAKKTVLDLLPKKFHHLSPVGRLDKDTLGLLLLTNDGELAFRLTHPRFKADKLYAVRVGGMLNRKNIQQLEKGIWIGGKKTSPAKVDRVKSLANKTEFNITIHEGQKRQIRLMLSKVGHRVVFLQRLAQGSLRLGDLKRGKWRMLTDSKVKKLKAGVGLT